jgi:hypothetical protein
MIEGVRLKDVIERSNSADWFPASEEESPSDAGIEVILEACPTQDDYKQIVREGTLIFIGGPRAY